MVLKSRVAMREVSDNAVMTREAPDNAFTDAVCSDDALLAKAGQYYQPTNCGYSCCGAPKLPLLPPRGWRELVSADDMPPRLVRRAVFFGYRYGTSICFRHCFRMVDRLLN